MPLPNPPTIRLWVLICGGILEGLGIICGGGVALYKLISNSKLPRARLQKIIAEKELTEAETESIEFRDQLSAIEVLHKFIRDGLDLEKLLQEKNKIIAQLEDEVYEKDAIIERQATDLQAYERMKLGVIGQKRLEQAENKTGTGE